MEIYLLGGLLGALVFLYLYLWSLYSVGFTFLGKDGSKALYRQFRKDLLQNLSFKMQTAINAHYEPRMVCKIRITRGAMFVTTHDTFRTPIEFWLKIFSVLSFGFLFGASFSVVL